MSQAAGYHGVDNLQYAVRGETPEIKSMRYARNISLNPVLENADQYANNKLILQIPRDNGYEGELGTTAPDPDFDAALGYTMEGAAGHMRVGAVRYKRVDLYYEVTFESEANTRVRKVWLLNCQVGKPAETAATDTSSFEFGNHVYPIRVYGDTALTDAETIYRDEGGNKRVVTMVYADPGDDGYDDFDKSVPQPIIQTPAQG